MQVGIKRECNNVPIAIKNVAIYKSSSIGKKSHLTKAKEMK